MFFPGRFRTSAARQRLQRRGIRLSMRTVPNRDWLFWRKFPLLNFLRAETITPGYRKATTAQ